MSDPLRAVVLWHPGAAMSTCDVAAGLDHGLREAGVTIVPYNTGAHIEAAGRTLHSAWASRTTDVPKPTTADIIYQASSGILERALRARLMHGAAWVIVVSGMYQHPDFVVMLRSAGLRVAVLLTESPYNMAQESAFAKLCDVAFTNERSAVEALRSAQPHTYYVPHAWHPGVHGVVAEGAETPVAAHDVVFVGTYFDERIAFLAELATRLRPHGVDLGLYGGTDEIDKRTVAGRALAPHIRGGYLKNAATAALYRAAKIGLNLHRTSTWFGASDRITHAESLNPRVYELAATGCYALTDWRAEADEVFGGALPTFTHVADCADQILAALSGPDADARRQAVAATCQARVQDQTWVARAAGLLAQLRAVSRPQEVAA